MTLATRRPQKVSRSAAAITVVTGGELRRAGVQTLPDALRPAQVVLSSALLYDDRARTDALALLGGERSSLDAMWRRSAVKGVHDDELKRLACRLWEVAIRGAERLGVGRDHGRDRRPPQSCRRTDTRAGHLATQGERDEGIGEF